MKPWHWIVPLILVLAIVGGLTAYFSLGNGKTLRYPGVVEVQEVRLGSKVGGRVESVDAEEGQVYSPNKVLVTFEAPELRNQKQQLEARLAVAKAELVKARNAAKFDVEAAQAMMDVAKAKHDRMQFGWREEEKKQAESELETARADYDQAMKDWVRISGLYRMNSVARTEYDAALAYRDRAKGRKDAAEAKWKMMETGNRPEDKDETAAEHRRAKANFELLKATRPEDIKVAEAKVAEIEATLDAVRINLDETVVKVPPNLGKAVVEVVAVRPGDLVPPNQPIIRVLRVEDLWVKVYVPETQYGLVTLGKQVEVTIDSHPGKVFKGKVSQRSNISEFTPRNVQSVDERRNQVFGVKILVEDTQGILNAGMAAEVTIKVD